MTGAAPKVFISYSHDTDAHQERVLDLADRLRADGIDAEIDQYNAAPPEGWPLWCERQIAAADIVLMVCTDIYHRRVKGEEQLGQGLGVVWEARIIRQLLYDAGAVSDKFVPVLFSDASPEQIPTPIRGGNRYVVDTEDGYEDLYRRLTGQPHLLRPALGTIRPLPTRPRQWPKGTASPPPALHDAVSRPPLDPPLPQPGPPAGNQSHRAAEGQQRNPRRREQPARFFVVIPTGGAGTSLFPITTFLPKCLVPIVTKPLLRHIIDYFIPHKKMIEQILILTSQFHDIITDAIEPHYGRTLVSVENTNAPVPESLLKLRTRLSGPFVLHYCDVLLDEVKWGDVFSCFYKQRADNSGYLGLLLCSQRYQMTVGFLKESPNSYLSKLYEKPEELHELFGGTLHINTGVAVFSPLFLDKLQEVNTRMQEQNASHDGIFETTIPELLREPGAPRKRFGIYYVGAWHHVHELKDLQAIQHDKTRHKKH